MLILEQTKLSMKYGGGFESLQAVELREVVVGGSRVLGFRGAFAVYKGRFEELNRGLGFPRLRRE